MYASQWFLTLFTAKFPLYMVFHIIDLLLCEVGHVHVHTHVHTHTHTGTGGDLCFPLQGISVIFNVALALLKVQKRTRARSPASCTLPCLTPLTLPPPPSPPDIQRRSDPERLRRRPQVLPRPRSEEVPFGGERQEADGAGLQHEGDL